MTTEFDSTLVGFDDGEVLLDGWTPTTLRTYARLPGWYRRADRQQSPAEILLYLIASIVEHAGTSEILLDRFEWDPRGEDTSDLADPDHADEAWLPWLAQLFGVDLDTSLPVAEQRESIANADSGWRAATRRAVRDAARSRLTGDRYVRLYPHTLTLDDQAVGEATMWDLLVVTRTSQTPDSVDVVETIKAKNAKPAGVTLHHEFYEASWDTLEAAYPTWDDWEAAGSWAALQDTLPP